MNKAVVTHSRKPRKTALLECIYDINIYILYFRVYRSFVVIFHAYIWEDGRQMDGWTTDYI